MNRLGFEVDDGDGLRQRLAAAGFRDSTYPNDHPQRRRGYSHDADGNDWKFTAYYSAKPDERNDCELADYAINHPLGTRTAEVG